MKKIKAFCITLKGCEDRQADIDKTFKDIGLDYEMFYGVDARNSNNPLLSRINETQFENYMGRPSVIGEVGCYASHFLLWQKCVSLNEPIIIFEDDFKIEEQFFTKTLQLVEENINDCGYIRTENTGGGVIYYSVKDFSDQKLVKYLKVPQCTTSYAISPRTAQAFITASQQFILPVDVFLRNTWIHQQAMFGICQAGLRGGNKPSIIGNRKRKGKKNYRVATMKLINKSKSMLLNLAMNIRHLYALRNRLPPHWKTLF